MPLTSAASSVYTSATTEFAQKGYDSPSVQAAASAATVSRVSRRTMQYTKYSVIAANTADNRFTRYPMSPTGSHVNVCAMRMYSG